MSQSAARLEQDLAHIREKLAALATAVQTGLADAGGGLLAGDATRAYAVVLGDHPINRASRELDRICHGFFAVHLPSAGHLRFVSAVMRVNLELERIGDYAGNICRETVQLGHAPAEAFRPRIEHMVDAAREVLSEAVAAFVSDDAERAQRGIVMANQVTRGFGEVFDALAGEEGNLRVQDLFNYLVGFNSLDRVVDQSKNICEEAVFAVSGQTKPPKSYRVLFLDEDNSLLGPMAQAIAARNFSQCGEYDTAGKHAATAINGNLDRFVAERGVELKTLAPKALDPTAELAAYHVIVSLQGPVHTLVEAVPFHTIALEWKIDDVSGDELDNVYRTLAAQIDELMTTLHGGEGEV